jgi:NAD(P)-dependent dehydrogenase (short-subunit alcohol dehydrogenase family)
MSLITPVVLVTGASRGLGRGIAVELAKSGFSVAINYAGNASAADETAKLCSDAAQSASQEFIPVQGDISSADSRKNLLQGVLDKMGRIDALVNNAGIAPKVRADITEASEESFDDLIQTNLKGPYFLTQAVVNHWLSGQSDPAIASGFKVIFVTSISSHTASTARGDYCISKAGLSMATQLWANRTAKDNIQVFEVRPGIMKTDMTSGVTSKYDALIADGLVPQQRWGTAEDLGLGVSALVEGKFPFSTGTVIDIDGGFQMRHL